MTDHPCDPFHPVLCCDDHHEREVRRLAASVLERGASTVRLLACKAGLPPTDVARFMLGVASLTFPARERVRREVGECR